MTYETLDIVTEWLAAALTRAGISNGDRVVVCVSRSIALHAAVLGTMKTGATFVPVDSETPGERIATIADECGAALVLVDNAVQARIGSLHDPERIRNVSVLLDEIRNKSRDEARTGAHSRASQTARGPAPDDIAYIIFTSGSTGKPKGIAVSHRNLCHFLRAENSLLGVQASDIVWQGFSAAFDMWIEESLISYSVGATLEIATQQDVRAVDRLTERLSGARVTVLHIVPTLAAAISENIPSLRLVNFGGEACSEALVKRWAWPNRRLFNTYGPTETTVSATMTELFPDRAVTIGRPLPNYSVYVVNEDLTPAGVGERGELLIGGPGVSQGYVNRPDLNGKKFISNPWAVDGDIDPVLYRTGDCVSVNPDGELEFHGRIDTQVKIRGFRVELEEIESVLAAHPGVISAAVAVERDARGVEHLVAFFVAEPRTNPLPADLRKSLQSRLPAYMMPTTIRRIERMPTLTSGKVDRKSLPRVLGERPSLTLLYNNKLVDRSRTKTEHIVIHAMTQMFGDGAVDPDADFFMDLGGHSLLAATLVSELRKHSDCESLSISDLYQHRTAKALARFIDETVRSPSANVSETSTDPRREATSSRYALCGFGQAVGLLLIFGVVAAQFFAPYMVFDLATGRTSNPWLVILATLGAAAALTPVLFATVVAFKWLLLGRVREGDYPLHGWFYLRWWLVRRLKDAVPHFLIAGTPFYALYLRALGARIGDGVELGDMNVDNEDLLQIGARASLSSQVLLDHARIENGWLKIRRITIGAGAYVGTAAVISGGCDVGAWSEIGDRSLVRRDTRIPAREIWRGSPAIHSGEVDVEALPEPVKRTPLEKALIRGAYLVQIAALSMLTTIPLLPVLHLMLWIDEIMEGSFVLYSMTTPLLALAYLSGFALEVWLMRWLVMGRLPAGSYAVDGIGYMRKWFVDQMGHIALHMMHPVHASLYLPSWFRLLGAKIGRHAEISTVTSVTYHLLEVDDESFVADRVVLGDSVIRNGWMELKPTRIGRRGFIGNFSVVADGTRWPDGCLLGVLSVTPAPEQKVPEHSTWLGVPASQLPRREMAKNVDPTLTYRPETRRYLGRLGVESARILAPFTVLFSLAHLLFTVKHAIEPTLGVWGSLALLPMLFLGCVAIPAFLFVVAMKWILVGTYRPATWPMWTRDVWYSEAVTSTYEAIAVQFLLEHLRGTPFIASALRLLGVKIGSRTVLETTDFTEFDLVEIGDDVVLDEISTVQTHLFEDRIMKMGSIKFGDRATVGARSVVLYDAELGKDVTLEANTLIMKGERLPPGTVWAGVPAASNRKPTADRTRSAQVDAALPRSVPQNRSPGDSRRSNAARRAHLRVVGDGQHVAEPSRSAEDHAEPIPARNAAHVDGRTSHSASMQWLCERAAVMRVHANFGQHSSDAWTWSCVIERCGPVVRLYGAPQAPRHEEWRAVTHTLRRAGFEAIVLEQPREISRTVTIKLTQPPHTPEAKITALDHRVTKLEKSHDQMLHALRTFDHAQERYSRHEQRLKTHVHRIAAAERDTWRIAAFVSATIAVSTWMFGILID